MTADRTRHLVTLRTGLAVLTALAAALALTAPAATAQDAGQDNNPGQDTGQDTDQDNNPGQDTGQDTDQDNNPGQDAGQDTDQDNNPGQDGAADDAPQRRGNPVEHCLPEQARDGGPGSPPETGTAQTPPETETAGPPETGTARSDVAQCVLDSLSDVAGNPHAPSIVSLVSERVSQGYPDGTFRPQSPVNRAQMGTFLTRALDLEVPEGGVDAPDVDGDHPHADGIAAVIESGIALGKADGSFGPGEPVSRGQMSAFLTRALDLAGEQGEVPEDAAGSVHDESISQVVGAGIAAGFPDGTFRPSSPVTRGQMSTFLARGLGLESA